MLTRDAILKANDIQQEVVEVPEWGGSVIVQGMTGQERDLFEKSIVQDDKDGENKRTVNYEYFRAKLLVYTVRNEDGTRMFDEADVEALGAKSGRAIQRIADVALKLSGLTEEDAKKMSKN